MDFKPTWDLGSIPDEILRAEWARRSSLRRTNHAGGRPPVRLVCPFCSEEFGYMEMRKHRPGCRDASLLSLGAHPIVVRSSSKTSPQDGIQWRIFSLTRESITLQTAVTLGSAIQHRILVPTVAVDAIRLIGSAREIVLAGELAFVKASGWVFTSADGLRVSHGLYAPDNDVFVFEVEGKQYEVHIYYRKDIATYEVYEPGKTPGRERPLEENALDFVQRIAKSMGGTALRKLR